MEGRWFYPGSGATSDTRPPPPRQSHASGVGAAEPSAAAAGTTQGGTADDSIVEDPDGEFSAASQEASSSSALRMINVGIPGPGECSFPTQLHIEFTSACDRGQQMAAGIMPALVLHHCD